MAHKCFLALLGLASLSLALSLKTVSIDEKMSFEEVEARVHEFVEMGFSTAKRKAPSAATPTYVKNHHGRRIPYRLKKSLQCLEAGYKRTSKLILERLELPEGMSKREALKKLGENEMVREIAAKSCNAEHLNKKKQSSRHLEIKTETDRTFRREFRTITGEDNNLANPEFGMSGAPFENLIDPLYADDECGLVSRGRRPNDPGNARFISNAITLSNNKTEMDEDVTVLLMQFGQFLDHDLTLFFEQTEFGECCGHGDDPEACQDIIISEQDPRETIHAPGQCIPFALAQTGESLGLGLGCEFRPNVATAWVDGSQVYGTSEEELASITETGTPFLLTSTRSEMPSAGVCDCIGVSQDALAFLPPDTTNELEEFLAGDPRVNEQPGLASMHTVFVRYHNILASTLQSRSFLFRVNPEFTFQLVRDYVIASLQHITFEEFLPAIMSEEALGFFNLTADFVYDDTINPGTFQEFAAACFRFGHTLIPNRFETEPPLELTEGFMNGGVLFNEGNSPTDLLNFEASTNAEAFDQCFVDAIRNNLFPGALEFNETLTQDLFSRNILRARDMGVSSFNTYREFFGFPPVTDIADFRAIARMGATVGIRRAYTRGGFDDLDLLPAALAEAPVKDGDKLGPTCINIIGEQFRRMKFGDRFFYSSPGRFSEEALDAIRSTSLADILCQTTCIDEIQDSALEVADDAMNPATSCVGRRALDRDTVTFFLQSARLSRVV